jgi:hypothetical protein
MGRLPEVFRCAQFNHKDTYEREAGESKVIKMRHDSGTNQRLE